MENENNIIRLSFLGDLMCTIPMMQKSENKSSYNFNPIFENVKKYLACSDYVIGNLETPLSGADCLYTFHPTNLIFLRFVFSKLTTSHPSILIILAEWFMAFLQL